MMHWLADRIKLLAPIMLLLLCHANLYGQQTAITSAARVHDLPADQAAKKIPVHLIATVTYYEPSERTLFVADDSGAVYVKTTRFYPIHRGDLIKIDGFTAVSFRTTVAPDPHIEVIGKGSFTRTKIQSYLSYRELMAGKWDCQYVVLHGTVRSALIEPHADTNNLEIEVLVPGGIVQAYLQDFKGVDPRELIDEEIEISGVIGGYFNAQWQLMRSVVYAADPSELRIIRKPRIPPSSLPLTDIDGVMQTHSIKDQSQRVRVRGTVTYYQPGHAIVIQRDGRSLFASTRQVDPIPLGAIVDLIGFAEGDGYAPTLAQTEIILTGQSEVIQPTPVTYTQAIGGTYSDDLVSLRGTVISQMHANSSDTLLLMVDNHAVTAVLQGRAGSRWLPILPTGTAVSVSGICRVTPGADWGTPGITPMLFRLDLRTAEDLRVISSPSWWTVGHLLVAIGALVGLSFLIAIWAIVLRKRVADQTATIERTVRLEKARSRILEAVNSEMPLDELLAAICNSVSELVPGIRCRCSVKDSEKEQIDDVEASACSLSPSQTVFTQSLNDARGRQIGTFLACGAGPRMLSHFETEVLGVGAALANLALNQRRIYQELNYTSTHDQLTSLPNRRLSDLNFEVAIQEAERTASRIAIAYIDVDRFKQVNDEHGHKIGDLYLQQIACRLISRVRTSDKLARIGGDEFLLIATEIGNLEDAEACRRRVESCFDQGFILEGARVYGSASIGIAVYPDHGSNAEELKRHADIDMYAAKRRRGADPNYRPPASGETTIFSPADLDAALENRQFQLYYQPQFSAQGKLRGLEALLRLDDPILGIVTPDAFISVAERNDVIIPVGAWVLRQALRDAFQWGLQTMDGVRMVVNVSARQIEQPDFAGDVVAALRECEMPASCLEIELTERTIARDIAQTMIQLNKLHAEGVRISIDDFGMEHSCLGVLHKLPIDTLKIDRSFVRALHREPAVLPIVETIVSMGKTMLKRIVAEGVETEEDIQALAKLGEMDLQGFYFSRPLSFEVISERLEEWRSGVVIGVSRPWDSDRPKQDAPAMRKMRREP